MTDVTTEVLDWFPHGETANALQDLLQFAEQYGVRVELQGPIAGPGGYSVRYVGDAGKIYHLLGKEYCVNEVDGSPEKELYILGLMGDKVAMHRWQTGCKAGLDPDPEEKKSTYEAYAWEAHWNRVGVKPGGEFDVPDETEVAIDVLAQAGYSLPDSEDDLRLFEAIDFAQSYLTLAFLHCPKLMDVMPKAQVSMEVLHRLLATAMKNGDMGRTAELVREIDARA